MPFKKIDARDKRARTYSKTPHATIGKGKIFLNAAAVKLIGLDTVKVEILIDEKSMMIAIRPAELDDPSAFPLIKPKNYLGGSVNSKNLVRDIRGVNHEQNQVYKTEWNDEDNMLTVDLNNPIK